MILFNSIFPKGSPLKDLKVWTRSVKFVNLGNTLLYDTLENIIYRDPNSSISYSNINNNLNAGGETVTPNISAYLSWARLGYSGNSYEQENITDYLVEYSVNTECEGFELNPSNGYVTCTNNITSNYRVFKVDVKLTMAFSGTVVTETITFNLNAGVKTTSYSFWETKRLSVLASPSNISAKGGDSKITTEAFQQRELYTYWNGVLTDTTIETRWITVNPTYSIDGDGFSMKDDIVTAENRGIIAEDARTAIITATYEGVTGTTTCTQDANERTNITYGDIIAEFRYPDKTPISGSVSPIITYSQSRIQNYSSDDKELLSEVTTGAHINYFVEESHSAAKLNTNTGVITWTNNISTSPRSCKIAASISLNGKLVTVMADSIQTEGYYTYSNYIVEITATPEEIEASGGDSLITAKAYRTYGWNGVTSGVGTEDGTIKLSKTLINNKVSFDNNTTTSTRSITITATCVEDPSKSASVTVTLLAGSVTYNINDTSLSFTAAKSTKTPSITYDTYWNGVRTSYDTVLNGYSLTESSDTKNAFTTNGTSVTASANTTTSSRTAIYNINKSGYISGTLTCTLDADSIKDYTHVINISASPERIDASGEESSTITATCKEYTNWVSGEQTGPTSETPRLYVESDYSGFTLNGTTLTASENTSESDRSCTITATCGGESASCTVILEGFTDYIVTYGTPTISIGNGMTAKGGSATVTASVINTYASGAKKAGTVTLEITSNGNNRFLLSGNTLSHDNMGTTTSESVTVTAYNADNKNKKASAIKTITNSVVSTTIESIDSFTFSYPLASSDNGATVSPTIGTVSATVYDTYLSGSNGSNYKINPSYSTSYTISNNYFSIDKNTGKCTTQLLNTDRNYTKNATVTLTITITGNYLGSIKTKTATTTVKQATYVPETKSLRVNRENSFTGGIWTLSSSSSGIECPPSNLSRPYFEGVVSSYLTYETDTGLPVNNASGGTSYIKPGNMVYIYDWYADGDPSSNVYALGEWIIHNGFILNTNEEVVDI